jgi:hypothetical protein
VPKRSAEVFLNVPYDKQFEGLFKAYVCSLCALGLVPRATIEIPGGARRLDRILEVIHSCEYSIHDLSRVERDVAKPRTPRFNMPFELGLSVAHEKSSKDSRHEWFVCESVNFRLAKSLSDLNGTDPYIHGGTVCGVFAEVRNMFVRTGRQATVQQMWYVYRKLRKRLPLLLSQSGSSSLYSAHVFSQLIIFANGFADEIVEGGPVSNLRPG